MEELTGEDVSPEQMLNRLRFIESSSNDFLFVCEDDSKILALLGFRIRENIEEASRFGEISAIVVRNKERNKGVGGLLMDYAEKFAKELGCKGLWLVSGFGREEDAHEFYQNLGFKITGYRFVKSFE